MAWTGFALGGLGYALFYACFTYPIPLAKQEGLQIVTGVGIGLSIVVPLIILQNAMPLKDMAAVTGSWSMSRNIGGAIGMSALIRALLIHSARTDVSTTARVLLQGGGQVAGRIVSQGRRSWLMLRSGSLYRYPEYRDSLSIPDDPWLWY